VFAHLVLDVVQELVADAERSSVSDEDTGTPMVSRRWLATQTRSSMLDVVGEFAGDMGDADRLLTTRVDASRYLPPRMPW